MNYDDELIRKVQLNELEILKIFQEICKRHNLRYFAIGGTCLGAVRHHGFIPWDDDVDVAMPYEDYVKFLELAEKGLSPRYAVIDHKKPGCDFPSAHACRFHDTNTTMIPRRCIKQSEKYRGVCIDIGAVTGLPSGKFKKKLLLKNLDIYYKLSAKLRDSAFRVRSVKSLLAYLMFLPLRRLNMLDYFSTKSEDTMKKYPFGCSDEILFAWRSSKPNAAGWYKNVFPYEYFADTISVPFEDTSINIPVSFDDYLRMDYGDYVTLPSEENRNLHYVDGGIIDFEHPYTYYVQQKEAGKLCS